MPKEEFGGHAFLERRELLTLEETRAPRQDVRRPRRPQGPAHRRRAAPPPQRRAARRAPGRDPCARRRPDDERLAARAEGGRARARRPRPRHREPRFARRRRVRRAERRRLPRRARARGHRRRRRGGAPGEGERRRQALRQRGERARARAPRFRGTGVIRALHRVHGRRADERLAPRRRRVRGGDRAAHRRDVAARAARSNRGETADAAAIATAPGRSASSPR